MDDPMTEERPDLERIALPVRVDEDWVQVMNESLEAVAALLGG